MLVLVELIGGIDRVGFVFDVSFQSMFQDMRRFSVNRLNRRLFMHRFFILEIACLVLDASHETRLQKP